MKRTIYADANASVPPHPEVVQAVLEAMTCGFGNPSSSHKSGKQARQAVEQARANLRKLLHADDHHLIFTSGGTEANNLALNSACDVHPGRWVLAAEIEHPSLMVPLRALPGRQVKYVKTDASGVMDLDHLAFILKRYRGEVALVSLMWANNETGVVQPVLEACQLTHSAGALFHTDSMQAFGKVPVSLAEVPADYLSLSAHKFGGPQGVGALLAARPPGAGSRIKPAILGGGQEGGLRSGTENVPGITGMGKAVELLEAKSRTTADASARDEFEARIQESFPEAVFIGSKLPRVPNTTLLRLPGQSGSVLVRKLDSVGIAVSTGSACHSGTPAPSQTLLAMGIPVHDAQEVVRVSFLPDASASDGTDLAMALIKLLPVSAP